MDLHNYTIEYQECDNNDDNVNDSFISDQTVCDDEFVTRSEFNAFKQSVREMFEKISNTPTNDTLKRDTNDIIYITGCYPVLKTSIAIGLSGPNPKLHNFFIEICKSAYSPEEYIHHNLKGSNGKEKLDEQKLSEIIRFTLSRWNQYWKDERKIDSFVVDAKSFQDLKNYFAQWVDRTSRRYRIKSK